ncbi:Zn(II)2Cys6 transcription factor [Aspergillus homomorphus CBS 101889]|uniref:Zn(2)-C6 fungal-type domain-containing protein n=1 Tax=Aspergillus homomorphus (strain CBS 101889) TaxID=1450537 RepID=A0A395HSS2_ASPHC|nr:hypothetical protein BO97DRAFT_458428 [Aspergillus homomorphus CBS 101889]RAL09274.1 hypothetical protein BO97DRAFT_458428 [Aspergillus homomorphus CBS 101889]
MLGHFTGEITSFGNVAAGDRQPTRKRHRARHTKSRRGCFSCKLRRVKCDEVQPVCGACSFREETCSYPDEPTISTRTAQSPAKRHRARTECSRSTERNPLDINLALSAGFPAPSPEDFLAMDNLRLVQFYHMYTGSQMTPHPKRTLIWQRILPIIAGENRFVMHLLLSVGGIHMMITQQTKRSNKPAPRQSESVELRVVLEHYQRGLQSFRDEVSQISESNAEAIFAGSMLLIAFAYASLQIPELNPPPTMTELLLSLSPQLSWLHLVRGIPTVMGGQWVVLKASRLRPMMLFPDDEFWKVLPCVPNLSRLGSCSPRILAFAQGANDAIASLKATRTLSGFTNVNSVDSLDSPHSASSSTTSDDVLDMLSRTIGTLEDTYERIFAAFHCSISEQGDPEDADIQANLEEAAILSWPIKISSDFLTVLETTDPLSSLWRCSLVIIAHFYVANTLLDTWYMHQSFEGEILKINDLIRATGDVESVRLMQWPVQVVSL